MRGRPCSICQHEDLTAIDAALAAGNTILHVAAAFSIPKSCVHRHKLNCLAPKVTAAAKVMQSTKEAKAPVTRAKQIAAGAAPTVEDVLSLTGLLERLARSLDRLENGAIQAAGNEQHASHAALAGQLHRGVETVSKLKGYYSDSTQVAEKSGFSVNIIIPQLPGPAPASRVIDGASRAIDVTPSPEPIDATPQVTVRRATARSFGFGGEDED